MSIDASVRASIPILGKLPSPALSISNLMPHSAEDLSQVAKVDKKDKVFLDKMVKVITKLETKYQTPTHKRKKRLFTRKQKSSPVVHKELATIYHCLAAPEPGAVTVPEPFPRVNWNLVEFKPVLPNPEPCPIYSYSQYPESYQDKKFLALLSDGPPLIWYPTWIQHIGNCCCSFNTCGWLCVLPGQ